ncbi:MAG: helix-turn-helix transcriptional regulator [Bacteroidetes bacterium]|nr:helix-turn-helix transcriptional regulator [Bacteroidota bacterium]
MKKRVRKSEIPKDVLKLGSRIADIIKEKGLKTREVAHDADMDVENLRKYIKGRQEMKISTLLKVAKALNVKIDELFSYLDTRLDTRKK